LSKIIHAKEIEQHISDVQEEAEVEGLLKPEEEDGDVKNVLSVLVAIAKVAVAL